MIEKSIECNNARRDGYKLLSECYYKPEKGLLNTLRAVDVSIASPLNNIAQNVPGTDQLPSLVIDFARLFVGPFKLLAYPYGSAYLDSSQSFGNDSTSDVKERYRVEGLDIVLKEAPDHIAIELEFMCFLAGKEIEARRTGDTSSAGDYVNRQISFLQAHLGMWILKFAKNVETHGRTDFYRNIARITETFVKTDLENLEKKANQD